MDILAQIVSLWERQIEAAMASKARLFGDRADANWQFYLGYDAILAFDGISDSGEAIGRKVRVNKAREFVALLLPHIHYKVPQRIVAPRNSGATDSLLELIPGAREMHRINSEQKHIRAALMSAVLNYLPTETGAYREQRMALPEALIKGRGVVWHEITEGPNGDVPGSFYDSVDDLFCDPDAKTWRTAGYIIRRREMLVADIEARYGLPQGSIKGQTSSEWSRALTKRLNPSSRPHEYTNDIAEFYEIYSRVGFGLKLSSDLRTTYAGISVLENLGPYVYLAIMPTLPHPLNLTPAMLESANAATEIAMRVAWPIQVQYNYDDPWPCTILDFYPHSSDPWADGCLDSVMPYQSFLNQVYCNLMVSVPTAASRLVVVSRSLESQVTKAILAARDLQVVYADERSVAELNKLIATFSVPNTSHEQWQLLSEIERQFERGSGLDPLLYGASGGAQSRSAADVQTRAGFLSARVNDFADAVADWNSRIARKEGQLCRLHLAPKTVAGIFAEPYIDYTEQAAEIGDDGVPPEPPIPPGPLTTAWMELVATDSPELAAAELDYTVAASTGVRKDRDKIQSDIQQIAQTFLPLAVKAAQEGMPGPYNAIVEALGEAYDWPDSLMTKLRWPEMPKQLPQQAQQDATVRAEPQERPNDNPIVENR